MGVLLKKVGTVYPSSAPVFRISTPATLTFQVRAPQGYRVYGFWDYVGAEATELSVGMIWPSDLGSTRADKSRPGPQAPAGAVG